MEGVAAKKRHPRPLQRTGDELFRRDRRRDGGAAGPDRRRQPLGSRTRRSTSRWRRCAARRTTPTSTACRAARSAGWRCASCCWKPPTCCCSTSRPTTSTPRPSPGCRQHLIAYKGTILIVTHDRYFLDDITGWILELDRGRGIPYEGNYSSWLEQKAKRLEQEAREDKSRSKTLERELEWIRQGAKARQAKQKARINAYNELAGQSEREKITRAQIVIPNGQRLGGKVIEVEGLKKAMGDKLLIEDLTFSLPPGGIVGVIGPNGAGKSTLFRMLTGAA